MKTPKPSRSALLQHAHHISCKESNK
uniref:Uncharacterized protein n=1 Tax=Arundo donax TaxID=35708 RepID=A0A0A9CM74_ARUDO